MLDSAEHLRTHLLADFARRSLQNGPQAPLQRLAAIPRAPDILAGAISDLHVLPNGRAYLCHDPLVRWQALSGNQTTMSQRHRIP